MKRIALWVFIVLLHFGMVNAAFPPEIPDEPQGLVYFPCDFNWLGGAYINFWNALRDILAAHGYEVASAQMTRGNPPGEGGPPVELLLNYLNSGTRGYICIYSHGGSDDFGVGWLAVEFFVEREQALLRKHELEVTYHAEGQIKVSAYEEPPHTYYSVDINSLFISDNVNNSLPHSFIFVDACYSAKGNQSIIKTFMDEGAHSCFGWNGKAVGNQQQAPVNIFYRMGGRNFTGGGGLEPVIQFQLFNKSAEQARIEYNNDEIVPHLVLMGNKDMRMYNSPRIVGLQIMLGSVLIYRYGFNEQGFPPTYPYEWEYPGDLSGCPRAPAEPGGVPLTANVLFSSPIDPGLANFKIESEQGTFSIDGEGFFVNTVLNNDLWVGTFDFSQWPVQENAIVRVDAEDLFMGDINSTLDINGDGQSDGTDRNHRFGVGAPRVIGTTPQDEATSVDVQSTITIDFNEPMDENTVNPQTILFAPPLLNSSFTTEWSGDWKRVTLTLTNHELDFQYHYNYTVTITDEVRDRNGIRLDGDNDGFPGGNYELHFETRLPHAHLPYSGYIHKCLLEGESFTTYVTIENLEVRTVTYQLFTLIEDPGGGWLLENLPRTQYVTLGPHGEPNCDSTWWWTITRQGAQQPITITFWPRYEGLDTDCGLEFIFGCLPFGFSSDPVKPIEGVWCKDINLIFKWTAISFEKKDKQVDSVFSNTPVSEGHQTLDILSDNTLSSDALDSQVRYVIQVDTNSDFLTPLLTDTTAETQATLNLGENRYFWRVTAYDLAGNRGFSNLDSFGVDITPPTIPIPIDCSNDTSIQNVITQPVWLHSQDNLSGVLNYQFQVSLNSDFIDLIKDTLLTDTSYNFYLSDTCYYWRVKALDKAGNRSNWSSVRRFELNGHSGFEGSKFQIPSSFALKEPFPNPFRVASEIVYTLPKAISVRLSVYNCAGKEIKVLDCKVHGTGTYKLQWNGKGDSGKILPAGIYFICFESESFKVMKKIVRL